MPENVNTSALSVAGMAEFESDARETMIKVDHVSMVFNMASEQLNSLKEYAIKLAKRELFFEGFTALDDVSFEVKKGDVFGIMGTNGSGKSTMMKIIAGVMDPTKGTCTVNGNIAPLIELGAGFDLDLTARENVYLNGALLGYSKKFIDEHFDEIVSFAEIEKFLDMPLKNYSSGMVARIAFAIATVIVPDILLVDEVLSVGDFMFQKKCEDRINQLIEEHGVTVLIVSHSNDQISRLCNKAIWIEKGHTRLLGKAETVASLYGNLAGRTGSPESEQRVLGSIASLDPAVANGITEISGQTSIGTNAKVFEACAFSEPQYAVVAGNGTHINAILAHPLASALDAPLLITENNSLSDLTEGILSRLQPRHIVVVDYDNNCPQVIKAINELPFSPNVHHLNNAKDDTFSFSIEVFEFGSELGVWENSPSFVAFEDNTESLAASVAISLSKSPVFASREGRLNFEGLSSALCALKAHDLTVFGPSACELFPKEEDANRPYPVTRCGSATGYESCLEICRFTEKRLHINRPDSEEGLFVSSVSHSQWQELLACGQLAAKRNAPLLLMDRTDLDGIAACLDYVKNWRGEAGTLTFIGAENCLNATERAMIASEIRRNNEG